MTPQIRKSRNESKREREKGRGSEKNEQGVTTRNGEESDETTTATDGCLYLSFVPSSHDRGSPFPLRSIGPRPVTVRQDLPLI